MNASIDTLETKTPAPPAELAAAYAADDFSHMTLPGWVYSNAEFFELEKQLVFNVLQQLPVEVSTDEGKSIGEETNTNLNAYRLLLEARGGGAEPAPPNKKSPPKASGSSPKPQPFLDGWRHPAFAAELEDHRAEVAQLLQEYRRAHARVRCRA